MRPYFKEAWIREITIGNRTIPWSRKRAAINVWRAIKGDFRWWLADIFITYWFRALRRGWISKPLYFRYQPIYNWLKWPEENKCPLSRLM